MGTNYYVVKNRPSCSEPIHIGKSSIGWLFNFQTQNITCGDTPVIWNSYPEVKDWLYKNTVENPLYAIVDEYDEIIPYEDFVDLIYRKQNNKRNLKNPDNFTYSKNVDGYRFTDKEFS